MITVSDHVHTEPFGHKWLTQAILIYWFNLEWFFVLFHWLTERHRNCSTTIWYL